MTSKLKCPFCQQELHKDPDGYYSCYTDNCSVMSAGGNGASGTESLWQALIQAKQDLEFFMEENDKSTTALIERTKELDKCQKDLETILTASKEIAEECGCLMAALKSTGFESVVEKFDKNIRKRLKQIEHKE